MVRYGLVRLGLTAIAAAQSALVQLDQLRVVEANNPQRSLELLAWWRSELAQCYAGRIDNPSYEVRSQHPVFVALARWTPLAPLPTVFGGERKPIVLPMICVPAAATPAGLEKMPMPC